MGLCFQTSKKGFYLALFFRPVGKVLVVQHSLLEHAVDSIKFTLDFRYTVIVVRVFDGLQTVLYGIESTLESIPFSIGSSIGLQTGCIEGVVCLHLCLCLLDLLYVCDLIGTGVIVPDELFHLIDRLIVFGQGLLDVSENFLVAAFCIDVLDQFGNLCVIALAFVCGFGHSLYDIVKGLNLCLKFADVCRHSFCPFSLSFGVCYGFFAFVFCFKFGKEIGNLSIEALNAFLVEIFCFRVFGTVKGSLQRIQFVSLPALCQSLVIVVCLLVGHAIVYFIDIGFDGLIGFRVLYATIQFLLLVYLIGIGTIIFDAEYQLQQSILFAVFFVQILFPKVGIVATFELVPRTVQHVPEVCLGGIEIVVQGERQITNAEIIAFGLGTERHSDFTFFFKRKLNTFFVGFPISLNLDNSIVQSLGIDGICSRHQGECLGDGAATDGNQQALVVKVHFVTSLGLPLSLSHFGNEGIGKTCHRQCCHGNKRKHKIFSHSSRLY